MRRPRRSGGATGGGGGVHGSLGLFRTRPSRRSPTATRGPSSSRTSTPTNPARSPSWSTASTTRRCSTSSTGSAGTGGSTSRPRWTRISSTSSGRSIASSGSTQPIDVLSGYRSPQTNAMLRRRSRQVAEHSQHMQGKAIDAHFLDVSTARIRDIAMRMQAGGVGFYPTGMTPLGCISTAARSDIGRR